MIWSTAPAPSATIRLHLLAHLNQLIRKEKTKMNEKIQNILTEIESVIVGKNENVEKILMAILAQGHVLMEDVPGVGKTTTALTFA